MFPYIFLFTNIFTLLFNLNTINAQTTERSLDLFPRDAKLNFTSIATEYGHTPLQYRVVTEDGYILTLFRLPGRSRYPVFLMHGIMDSADTWIIRGEESLAITLANRGYDVWVGNARGNRYSRRHLHLNPDEDASFWSYSFHEIGNYDLPAFIDRILKETRSPTLTAIGHSQGTTSFFALGATRPEYNKKINLMMALAPVCYLHHSIPPISTFIKITPLLEQLLMTLNINEVLGDADPATQKLRTTCKTPLVGYEACIINLIFPFTGYDPVELEPLFTSTAFAHFPAGTSARTLTHYLQVGYRQVFARFDNGPDGNRALYNSTTPPPYDLGRVTMPIALIAAKNDYLSMVSDVALLREQLPNVVYYLVNPRVKFNHADYIWGRRMRLYLFPYIFQLLRTYNRID